MSEADWNPVAYDDLSDPMFEWGMAILGTLKLNGNEHLLDAGCGSGRLTEELLRKLPSGKVIALDFSPNMLSQARIRLAKFGEQVAFIQASLQEFELDTKVDGIFSNAVLHWVPDHDAMFRSLYRALKPGGWLVAQFGGVGNLARTLARARVVAGQPTFSEYLQGVEPGPHFEETAVTRQRMEAAGFHVSESRMHTVVPRFERKERYEAFLATVVLRQVLAKLPEELRHTFLEAISNQTLAEEGAYSLDYVRMTIRGQS